MAETDDGRLLALLGLRLKGFAPADAVAEVVGAPAAEIAGALDGAVEAGLVRFNEARSVYLLDPATGRPEGERLLAAQIDAAGVRDQVTAGYQSFLELNGLMLQLCTDWQVRADLSEQTLNDHSDEDYDEAVMARLVDLDGQLRTVLATLSAALGRYSTYGPRFGEALNRLLGGEIEYFTKPIIPSYHTVWFELHEDLLASLGIDRASEGST